MLALDQSNLKKLLNYDPSTGVFIWRVSRGRVRAGSIAGCVKPDGYRKIVFNKAQFLAHRLVWLYVHGRFPKDDIDHINGIPDDNRLCNLRKATRAENHQNRSIDHKNTSGFPGVYYHKASGKWMARISVNKKRKCLGYYDAPQFAGAAYLAAKVELHTFSPIVRTRI